MNTQRWLAAFPPELSTQRALLGHLLDTVDHDPRWRWVELGCSVAQGRSDTLSDLDMALGIAEEAWPDALDDLRDLLRGLGDTVDVLTHRLPEMGNQPHQRLFIQYADGSQIDLVAVPAHLPKGTQPENVILYDPDALRADRRPLTIERADAASIREWAFLGWIALADLTKYLRRDSPWEALQRLEETRTQIWRLWAAARNVPYPIYGLTAVLDHPAAGIPPGIENTMARLDRAAIVQAALCCAQLLDDTAHAATSVVGGDVPDALAAFVQSRLHALAD